MLSIKIITPLGLYMEREVEAVHVKTVEGETTLLPNHIPLVAMLETCKLQLKEKGTYKDYALAGGMLHLLDNKVNILTDAIEGHDEIDIERARKALERAQRRLEKKDSQTNQHRAEVAMAKAINRIHVYSGH